MSYKTNFLDRVIVRFDVLDPFDIKDSCPEGLKKALRRIGQIESCEKKLSGEFKILPEGVLTQGDVTQAFVWHFDNREKGCKVSLSEDFFAIEYFKYESFDKLLEDYERVKEHIAEHLGTFTVKRLGLRFIDIINAGTEDPLEWSKYITPAYLVTTDEIPPETDRAYLSRAFNRMEYSHPDMRILIQYGIHNPSYPSPISLRQYILDTDVSSVDLLEIDQLSTALSGFHSKAKEIFESAITEPLRDIMNA